jgi:hypothetical protein
MFAASKATPAIAISTAVALSIGFTCLAVAQTPSAGYGPIPATNSLAPVATPAYSAAPSANPAPAAAAPNTPAATVPLLDPSRPTWHQTTATDPAPAATPIPSARRFSAPGASGASTPAMPFTPVSNTRTPIAKVTNGNGTLPNDHGQIWREYDISPYTLRVTSTNRPEQAIVDWILRETGYEAWHSEPLGILAADHRTLRVYHTPEMQAVVAQMIDRFVSSAAETQAFGLRVVGVASPSWRAKAQRILHPVPVQSQGIQAWLLAKEDASLLLADLRRRSDFREYNTPHLLVTNGQAAVVSTMHPHNYTSGVTLHPEQAHPGFEPQVSQFEEGFSLELDPLLALDGKSIDAMIKCHIDQLERLVPVTVDVPTVLAPRQHTEIEVPQWSSYRVHERFHWPVEQVLLLSMGVVAAPATATSESNSNFPFVGPPRTELLVFVASKGAGGVPPTTAPQAAASGAPQTYQGRY